VGNPEYDCLVWALPLLTQTRLSAPPNQRFVRESFPLDVCRLALCFVKCSGRLLLASPNFKIEIGEALAYGWISQNYDWRNFEAERLRGLPISLIQVVDGSVPAAARAHKRRPSLARSPQGNWSPTAHGG
jgi:hypothetical protein